MVSKIAMLQPEVNNTQNLLSPGEMPEVCVRIWNLGILACRLSSVLLLGSMTVVLGSQVAVAFW